MIRAAVLAFALATGACASAPPPLEGGRVIASAGGDIYTRSWGDPARPAVLMIHGTTSHLEEFEVSLGPQLADDFHLVAYDRPGMGRSTHRPAGAASLALQAQAAADVIRAENLQRPVIVGHSYGAAVALRVALDHPELVSGVVLLAPATHPWDGSAPGFYKLQAAPVIGDVATMLAWPFTAPVARRSLASRAFAPQPMPKDYFDAADVRLALRPAAVRASSADFVSLVEELKNQAPRYAQLDLPVSIIAGEDDRIIPFKRLIDRDKPAFANAHVALLPGVGHMPQHARPDLVEQEINWAFASARAGR
jgi:pimeloyl-ACP methyl ester carboxylesterase